MAKTILFCFIVSEIKIMARIIFILLLLPLLMNAQKLTIENHVKFLALGDSYTIGESVSISERWPNQMISDLRKKGFTCDEPKIIATTGWRTDELMRAVQNAKLPNDYTLVSLLIGVNNFYQAKSINTYANEFEKLLTTAIKLAGQNKQHVFVVSIPDYGFTPFGESDQVRISKGIDAFNAINKKISDKHGVAWFNITDISRQGLKDPSLIAGDGLHPSGRMYRQWVDVILSGAVIKK
jgi:lysophospholipase L1-like esterase